MGRGDAGLAPAPLDVGAAIDDGAFTNYQKFVIAATASMIVLDGMDGQLLANAIPSMTREWSLPRTAFATASAAAPFGMMLGGVLGGMLSDRIGRRTALLASVLTFAALTLAAAFVNTIPMLTLLRFVAGVGLGGAMPNAAALVAEFAPRRRRPLAITATIVCIPVGGFLGGLIAGQTVPLYGWRSLFVIGGLVPALLALSLVKLLPESPRYLAARKARWPELARVLKSMGLDVRPWTEFVETSAAPAPSGSVAALFAPELRRDTVSLITAFTSCLLAIWIGFLWIPAMLTDAAVGFAEADASYALSLFNFGGISGALVGAIVIQRFGSRLALLATTGLALVAALVMAALPPSTQAFSRTMVLFAVTGALMNAVQATMYALAAHVFPTSLRGTGVGTTVAIGRVGNVLASYVGSWALVAGGPPLFCMTWAAALAIVFVALSRLRRHIPPSSANASA
jgi:MFS transporter, AAHS family, 4-hydroxybenzoate transporter